MIVFTINICKPYIVNRARICKRLWSPGIDSREAILPAYVAWRASTTNRVFVPARQAGNRFLGTLKGPQIRAQKQLDILGWLCKTIRVSLSLATTLYRAQFELLDSIVLTSLVRQLTRQYFVAHTVLLQFIIQTNLVYHKEVCNYTVNVDFIRFKYVVLAKYLHM